MDKALLDFMDELIGMEENVDTLFNIAGNLKDDDRVYLTNVIDDFIKLNGSALRLIDEVISETLINKK